jgi:putative transposase
MSQSLSNILVHLIFSTKNRECFLLDKRLRERSHAYLAEILRDFKTPSLIVGGVADHVHALCHLSRTQTIAKVIEHLKTSSSKWLKTEGHPAFSWQRGYGAFSIGASTIDSTMLYIKNQEEHHQRMTFQEEYRLFLKRYRIAFDERYVWD